MTPELELLLGVGLVRNSEYIGLYLNLTAWNHYRNENSSQDSILTNIIRLSLRLSSKIYSKRKLIISVILSILTSAAPPSVVLSLFSKRKEGERRAQRRSGLTGLQILERF